MPDERQQYGGQAVVEGVMMRSPRFFAVACRRVASGEITVLLEPVQRGLGQWPFFKIPFIRGTAALVDSMSLGMKALTYSANVQTADTTIEGEAASADAANLAMGEGGPVVGRKLQPTGTVNGIAIGIVSVLAMIVGFGLFWTLPAFIAQHLAPHAARLGGNLLEGLIRLAIFFAYIGAVSQMAHVKRVFQYHGAEHQSINALESGLPLNVESARESSRIHPRCGTNFIFIVLVVSVFVFSLLPRHGYASGAEFAAATAGLRLVLLPVVAGVSYEILRWAGTHRAQRWAQILIAPGLWTQYLTTRPPNDEQLEVALAALNAVRERELMPNPSPSAPADEPAATVA